MKKETLDHDRHGQEPGPSPAGSLAGTEGRPPSSGEMRTVVSVIRCFVACDLPAEVVRRLTRLQESLREPLAREGAVVKWVAPHSLHLTLRFLGNTDAASVPALHDRLAEAVTSIEPFGVRLVGLGAFPRAEAARVLWVGLDPPSARAAEQLAAAIEAAVVDAGFPPELRAFVAHLTIGRISNPAFRPGVARVIQEVGEGSSAEFGTFRVDRVVLYESVLKPTGAEYRALAYIPLRSGGGATDGGTKRR